MKKFFLFLLVLTSAGLFSPKTALAADQSSTNKHFLMAKSGPRGGEVTLSWRHMDDANNYHLVYGTQSGKYIYGAINIGWVNSFTVAGLVPGKAYYFALVPVKNDVALYTSAQIMAYAGSGTVVTPVTPVTPVKSVTPVTPVQPPVSFGPAGKHMLRAFSGPRVGEVTLNWRHIDDANNYHLVYGTQPGKFTYGALNIGWVNSYTVKKLVPGVTYYFALVPVKNDTALYTTDQVMGNAYGGVQVVQTTPEALRMPASPPTSDRPSRDGSLGGPKPVVTTPQGASGFPLQTPSTFNPTAPAGL